MLLVIFSADDPVTGFHLQAEILHRQLSRRKRRASDRDKPPVFSIGACENPGLILHSRGARMECRANAVGAWAFAQRIAVSWNQRSSSWQCRVHRPQGHFQPQTHSPRRPADAPRTPRHLPRAVSRVAARGSRCVEISGFAHL